MAFPDTTSDKPCSYPRHTARRGLLRRSVNRLEDDATGINVEDANPSTRACLICHPHKAGFIVLEESAKSKEPDTKAHLISEAVCPRGFHSRTLRAMQRGAGACSPASARSEDAPDPVLVRWLRGSLLRTGGAHYLRVPRRIRALADFQMPDLQWESLMIPINLAFFYRDSAADKVSGDVSQPRRCDRIVAQPRILVGDRC